MTTTNLETYCQCDSDILQKYGGWSFDSKGRVVCSTCKKVRDRRYRKADPQPLDLAALKAEAKRWAGNPYRTNAEHAAVLFSCITTIERLEAEAQQLRGQVSVLTEERDSVGRAHYKSSREEEAK